MNLDGLKKKKEEIPAGYASFEGKFSAKLAYTPRSEMQKIIKRCKKTVYKKHQPTEEVDSDRLYEELAKKILGWDGLTVGVVATMIPINVPEGKEDAEVPCTEANKLTLLKDAYYFDTFVQEASTDLSMLKEEREEGNSGSGPGTT